MILHARELLISYLKSTFEYKKYQKALKKHAKSYQKVSKSIKKYQKVSKALKKHPKNNNKRIQDIFFRFFRRLLNAFWHRKIIEEINLDLVDQKSSIYKTKTYSISSKHWINRILVPMFDIAFLDINFIDKICSHIDHLTS